MAKCSRKREIVSYDLELSSDEACVLWRILRGVGGPPSGPRGLTAAIEEALAKEIPVSHSDLDEMFWCKGAIQLKKPQALGSE